MVSNTKIKYNKLTYDIFIVVFKDIKNYKLDANLSKNQRFILNLS